MKLGEIVSGVRESFERCNKVLLFNGTPDQDACELRNSRRTLLEEASLGWLVLYFRVVGRVLRAAINFHSSGVLCSSRGDRARLIAVRSW